MKKFVLATNNPHKVYEFEEILKELSAQCVSLKELGVEIEVVEDGRTFEENAFKKAYEVMKATGLPAFADDSGISVDALSGEPGIYSARYGGDGLNDEQRLDLLIKNTRDKENKKAHYTAAIACVFNENDNFVVTGECHGTLISDKRGENGFGYDPIFIPNGKDKTFSELTIEEKNKISHRAKAFEKMMIKLRKREK